MVIYQNYTTSEGVERVKAYSDGAVPNESMIVCDYNETYYVKGEGIV